MKTQHTCNSGPRTGGRHRARSHPAIAAAAIAAGLLWAAHPAWSQVSSGDGPAGQRGGTVQAVPPPPVTSGGPDLPSVIVVPHGHRQDEMMANGCWVRFYADESYGGRSLTLVGPVQMPKIHVPGGLWIKWSSAIVGPRATVTTYDFEQYKNATAVLRPGQRIEDLRDRKLGLFEDIHSLRIACRQ